MNEHPKLQHAEYEMAVHRAEVARRVAATRAAVEVLVLEAEVAGQVRWRWCEPDETADLEALAVLDSFPGRRWWRDDEPDAEAEE